ncbi:unnamed protein product [Amoebophrya sp. A25]|nr:unnamed protein product [Amoebophrya sp. A25]|eukprot:GSA25T00024849001.1
MINIIISSRPLGQEGMSHIVNICKFLRVRFTFHLLCTTTKFISLLQLPE